MPEFYGRLRNLRLTAAPASPQVGEQYYDTTANVLYWWNGSAWQSALGGGGLTLPLTQNLTFSPDSLYDIGASAASRPRDVFVARNLSVEGQARSTTGHLVLNTTFAGASVDIQTQSTLRWSVDSSGHLQVATDNVTDIGNPSTRVRSLYVMTPTVSGQINMGGTSQVVKRMANDANSLSVETSTGYMQVSGKTAALLSGNAYYDGSNWLRFDVASGAMSLNVGAGAVYFYATPSGSNPIAWTQVFNVSAAGNLAASGILQSTNGNLYLINGNTSVTSDGANLLVWANSGAVFTRASGLYVQNPSSAYVPVFASAFTVSSARRFKTDFQPLASPLSLVLDERVQPLSYVYGQQDRRSLGFVAEDMLQVVPDVVVDEGINYGALVPVLWGAVRELSARLSALENAA